MKILVFVIENRKYAVDLECVERSLLAVEATSVPNSPEYVLGAINVHGEIIPVINMREVLELQHKEIGISDHFILCNCKDKKVALLVDHVEKIKDCEGTVLDGEPIQCVLREEGDITLLCNLEKLIPERSLSIG